MKGDGMTTTAAVHVGGELKTTEKTRLMERERERLGEGERVLTRELGVTGRGRARLLGERERIQNK